MVKEPPSPILKDLLQRLRGIYDMQSTGPEPVERPPNLVLLAFQTLQTLCNDSNMAAATACKLKTSNMTAAGTDTLCLHSNDAADLSRVLCFIGLSILS